MVRFVVDNLVVVAVGTGSIAVAVRGLGLSLIFALVDLRKIGGAEGSTGVLVSSRGVAGVFEGIGSVSVAESRLSFSGVLVVAVVVTVVGFGVVLLM